MILHEQSIDFQWPVQDPFLFCVHHLDHYPKGNQNLGVDSEHFVGRNVGSDFTVKNGFRLYHGREIPGFPVHPHRGFETITIVRKGYVDHADSMGAMGRYGEGDVQWMSGGAGVQHSEMFPLLHQDKENTTELFQIWLNLPKKSKMTSPDFKMLWAHKIPRIQPNLKVEMSLICGEFAGQKYNESPQSSWARDPENEVNILLVKMQPEAEFSMPAAKHKTNRTLYFFEGKNISVNESPVAEKAAIFLDSSHELKVKSTEAVIEFLILEARPISEPVVQHGPFVMNSREEILQAFNDYQQTQFGGWDWARPDMIHGPLIERFARHPDGHMEKPDA